MHRGVYADVTAPTRRRAKRRFKVHFSSILADGDRSVREGIPVTALPRTLLDLAITARPDQMERYLERAEEKSLLDVRAIEDLLSRSSGHRGRGRLANALVLYRPELRFAVELDLYETHGTRAAFERDRRREVGAAQPA